MPTAKPRYDGGGDWKHRHFDQDEWEAISERIRKKLRCFYPDKNAKADPPFGHPADEWANYLLDESKGTVSLELWLRRRLTNAELRAERKDLLNTLNKADKSLSNLSLDLKKMLGVDADIRGCRDKIEEFMQRLEDAGATIDRLPKARKLRDVQHSAAVEMAVRVLRILKQYGVSTAATAAAGQGRASDAVQILKILGDAIGLPLSEVTWKGIIIEAKPSIPPRR